MGGRKHHSLYNKKYFLYLKEDRKHWLENIGETVNGLFLDALETPLRRLKMRLEKG